MTTAPAARTRARPAPAKPAVQPAAKKVDAIAADATPEDLDDNIEGLVDLTELNPLDNKDSEISKTVVALTKRHGTTTIFRASMRPRFHHVSTGCFTMDLQMLGGVPQGLVTLNTGWQHSGKTTFSMRQAGEFQRAKALRGMSAAMVDIEGTYDPIWGAKHGVDNDGLILVQPTTGEDACDIVDAVIRSREVSVVVVDSVAGLIPLKEIEASTEDSVMGKYAQLISRFCRKTQQALLDERKRGHWCTVILTNQYRMSMSPYGDPRVLPGGKATPFLASYWYDYKAKEIATEQKNSCDPSGRFADQGLALKNEHTITKRKNKLGNGRDETVFTMIRNPYHPLGEGFIDEAETVLTEAKRRGFIVGTGVDPNKPPFRIEGLDEKFRGLGEMVAFCYSDLDFYEQLKVKIISHQRAILGMDPNDWQARA